MSKIDAQNLKSAMYEGELSRFKFDLRNIEKVMNDISELDNNLRDLHLEVNTKNLEHAKRITNLSDREKVFEMTLRGFDNDVKVVKTELKSVERLVIDTKEASTSIFARAVGDFEARHQLVMEQLKKNSEKVNDAVAHLDKTKEQLRNYDKKITQMNLDNKHALTQSFETFKNALEGTIKLKLNEIDLGMLNQNRHLSDISKHQLELDNYIDKYLPYNSLVDVLHMLTQTVPEPSFFNAVCRYSLQLKTSFNEGQLERNTPLRMHTLDKRLVKDLVIPRRRKVIHPNARGMLYGSKGKAKEDDGEDEISPENAELSLMLKVRQERRKAFKFDREVKDAIRESRRRYSLQRGTRRNDFTTINGMQMNFQRFLKEVRVTSKDEHRFEAIRNEVKFNDKIHKIDGM